MTCALTGPIVIKDPAKIRGKGGEDVFSERKGLGFIQNKVKGRYLPKLFLLLFTPSALEQPVFQSLHNTASNTCFQTLKCSEVHCLFLMHSISLLGAQIHVAMKNIDYKMYFDTANTGDRSI